MKRLGRSRLPSDAVELARFLIGTTIVSDHPPQRVAVRIVETEAYLPDDPAAHSFVGKTARNASLFLRHGHAYVYQIYGLHLCLNVSAERPATGAGVLLRAGEVVVGRETARVRRGAVADRDLARGPGRLAQALGVVRKDDGLDLLAQGPLWLAEASIGAPEIAVSPRIGITKAAEAPLRFFAVDDPHVSGPKFPQIERA